MSGGRLITMLTHELRRTGGRYGLATMCIGVGQGIATIVERLDGLDRRRWYESFGADACRNPLSCVRCACTGYPEPPNARFPSLPEEQAR